MTFNPDTRQEVEPQELASSPGRGAKRQDIMLCYPFEEKRLLKWNSAVLVQPKLDGERCRALIYNNQCTLLSSTGDTVISVPHINKALLDSGFRDVELDGELYIHGLPFEEIHSRVSRKVNPHPYYLEVSYHIFDIVSSEPQALRISDLVKMNFSSDAVHFVHTVLAENLDQIMRLLDVFLSDGYEGIIIRHPKAPYKRSRSTNIMKFKPRREDSYKVIGFQEEVDKNGIPKNRLGALICKDDMGTEFSVGSGFTADQRQGLWLLRDHLPGMRATVKYQHLTPGRNVPRFPVFVEVK